MRPTTLGYSVLKVTTVERLHFVSDEGNMTVFFFVFRFKRPCLTSRREGRAHLARVAHLTHFPTLTNVTRRDGTWSDQPDEAGGHDPLKQPPVPVRPSYSLKEGNLTLFYELLVS